MEGHLKDKHGIEEVIGCKQCEMKFSGREEMVEHLFEHRAAGIICDICGAGKQTKFEKHSDFREHYFGVHKLCPRKYKCGKCEKWFWRTKDKEEHELRAHSEDVISMPMRFRNQIAKSKKNKNFECDLCHVKFYHDADLITHKIKLHGGDPICCHNCGEKFDDKAKFNKHMKEHSGIPVQWEWKCEVEGCGKIFKEKRHWKHHNKVGHGGERSHVCEICGKGYTFAIGLKTHQNAVHLKLKPCVCDECGERFGSLRVLKTHKLIHTGERPFGCDICGQRFRHKEVMKRHIKGHEEKGADFKPNGPMKQIRKRKAQ